MWATAISVALTTLASLALRAGQPAALATTLLVSLGAMQTRRDAIVIVVGVLLMAAIGEPVRRLRLKSATSKVSHMRLNNDREESTSGLTGSRRR